MKLESNSENGGKYHGAEKFILGIIDYSRK